MQSIRALSNTGSEEARKRSAPPVSDIAMSSSPPADARLSEEESAKDDLYWSASDLTRGDSAHSRPKTSMSSRSAQQELEEEAKTSRPQEDVEGRDLEHYATAEREGSNTSKTFELLEITEFGTEFSVDFSYHDKHE
eukprot:746189-Hanusia_phi.AAC.1